jgi:transcriptional regulator with XRE-family HTH domain
MTFSQLHERLRLEMWRRIQRGVVTGKLLAAQTGLRPSHISNFLHRKRKLSLAALDRLLAAQQISIRDLAGLAPETAESHDPSESGTLRIPLVSQTAAITLPIIPRQAIESYITLPLAELDHFPLRHSALRRGWERFIAIRISADQASEAEPLLRELSLVIIDRHYHSLISVAPPHPNLYAIQLGNKLLLRYVSFESNRLLLRPHRLDFPIQALEIAPHAAPGDLLVGRVCLHISEA